ncbi:hypothetical protein Droror1_Dr00024277, partial [Drosera rotundifolia]
MGGASRVGGLMIEGGLVLISIGNVKPLLVGVTVVAVLVNVLVMVDEIPLRLGFLIWRGSSGLFEHDPLFSLFTVDSSSITFLSISIHFWKLSILAVVRMISNEEDCLRVLADRAVT